MRPFGDRTKQNLAERMNPNYETELRNQLAAHRAEIEALRSALLGRTVYAPYTEPERRALVDTILELMHARVACARRHENMNLKAEVRAVSRARPKRT